MGILSKLRDLFRGRPKAPKVDPKERARVRGHGGVAAGSLKPAADFAETGRIESDVSSENIAKWRTLGSDEVYGFVWEGDLLPVHSSNVAAAQYFPEDRKMMVEYLGGSAYLYSSISVDEAIDFAKAQSKGGWIWSVLRVRGSKTRHRKPFTKIR